jgi:hypothetical protein
MNSRFEKCPDLRHSPNKRNSIPHLAETVCRVARARKDFLGKRLYELDPDQVYVPSFLLAPDPGLNRRHSRWY